MPKIPDKRAYIKPLPSLSEVWQRESIAAVGEISEWYTESKSVTRAVFIKQLRVGSVAVVAYAACLATSRGRKIDRFADLLEAKGEIHSRGAVLLEAATGFCSNRNWPKMKAAALPMLGRLAQGSRSALNGKRGADGYAYTVKDMLVMLRIMDSSRYNNHNERKAAMQRNGVYPVPGRTWLLTKLRVLAREYELLK